MTPLELLVNTLVTGAAAQQTNPHLAVRTAYAALTAHLARHYPAVDLGRISAQPTSARGRDYLHEDLQQTPAVTDPTLLALAASLATALAQHQPAAAQVVAVDLHTVTAQLARLHNLHSSGDGLRVTQSTIDELEVDSVTAGASPPATSDPDRAAALHVKLDQSKVDTLVVTLGRQTPAEVRALTVDYLHRLVEQLDLLPLSGVDRKAASDHATGVRLSAVYTALLTENSDEWTQQLQRAQHPDRPTRRSAVEQLNRQRKLVLLGDPGSGKSSFVNFVALCHAGALLDDPQINLTLLTAPLPPEKESSLGQKQEQPPPQPWDHGPLLPVRIVLRDWAASHLPPAAEPARASHLWAFIAAELTKAELGAFAEPLRRHLHERGGLVLFDGLDEVPEADQCRMQIKAAVEDFAASFGRCRLLITSRTYAYQNQAWQLQGFTPALLAPFSPGQIRHFVDRWYDHRAALLLEAADLAQARAAELKAAIFANPRLHDLVVRPLLLALTASLHAWRNGKLPNNRQELYDDAVDLLLEQWEAQRIDPRQRTVRQPSLAAYLAVGRDQVLALLQRLAYAAHASQPALTGTADIAEADLVNGLLDLSQQPDLQPRQLINYLSQRAGLLYERGVKVYTFPHRTFQEYLAACHLTTKARFPSDMATLLQADPNRWREVTLLAAAKAKRGAIYTFWALIDKLCRPDQAATHDPAAAWGALLAGQAMAETVDLTTLDADETACLTRIRTALVQVVTGRMLPAVERALAGRTLAHLGDPRPAVLTIDHMQFCAIPAEPVPAAVGKKSPKAGATLPTYWISRYPVTNAQFHAFVAARGYTQARYWSEAQKAKYWSLAGFQGRYDDAPRTAPYAFREPFNLPNHPVVGVTWYEALAFCHWLQEQITQPGWTVRLPTSAEWTRAACGGTATPMSPAFCAFADQTWELASPPTLQPNPHPQRTYPWGNAFDAELTNCQETNLGATSAVGSFSAGASPYGVEEMSGNVWEWLLADPGDLAGGSWAWEKDRATSAARRDFYPYGRYDLVGFRCVVVPISR